MKKQTNSTIIAHLLRGAFYLLLLLAVCAIPFALAQPSSIVTGTPTSSGLALNQPEASARASHPAVAGLTFADRVAYQGAIEEVYWRHRIWPDTNPGPKPPLDDVMSQAEVEKKVKDYLGNSEALEDYWQRPISADQLQAEMERMASHTKQPEVLRELFEALGNDPLIIAECLARPVLAERLIADLLTQDETGRFESLRTTELRPVSIAAMLGQVGYTLPVIAGPSGGCTDDTWTPTTLTNGPTARIDHTAVWTGSEMIVWGGFGGATLNTGGRYNPSTDTWTPTSTTSAPEARDQFTAVWTGSEMIVWGGYDGLNNLNTGGRYNPIIDSWTATNTTNAPTARTNHTAVWTGSEMIVWGGFGGADLNTGGKYNPSTDSWTATSTTRAPHRRSGHTAVWTGSEMIVWGGFGGAYLNTGGKYNPITNSWTATSITGAPAPRGDHTAVWTGSEMIVWGGDPALNTGGRYDPGTDSWTATSMTDAPPERTSHTAVWTGSEMIVWGGIDGTHPFNTGGRYNPGTDSWTATSTTNAPDGRLGHTAVWTESEMIVWGGFSDNYLNTGGRYCAAVPGPFTLSALGRKVGGINTVRLTWSGATSTDVDVYRDGVVIVTTANDGFYKDSTGDTGRARYIYRVCEAGTQTCSNEVTVRFRQ